MKKIESKSVQLSVPTGTPGSWLTYEIERGEKLNYTVDIWKTWYSVKLSLSPVKIMSCKNKIKAFNSFNNLKSGNMRLETNLIILMVII